MVFWIFINLVILLPIAAATSPALVTVILRVFGAACFSLWVSLLRGFSLMDELTEGEVRRGSDSFFLHLLRYCILGGVLLFTLYLCTGFCCMFAIYGTEELRNGQNPRRANHVRRFKRIPLGNMLYHDGINCSICLENFRQNQRVVQLTCHRFHIFHRDCIDDWVSSGHNNCPLCRVAIGNDNRR